MSEVALVQDGSEIVSRHRVGGWVKLPNGDWMSPAIAGWEHPTEDYRLLPIIPVEVPAGKRAVGRTLTLDGEVVVETAESFADMPSFPWLGGE